MYDGLPLLGDACRQTFLLWWKFCAFGFFNSIIRLIWFALAPKLFNLKLVIGISFQQCRDLCRYIGCSSRRSENDWSAFRLLASANPYFSILMPLTYCFVILKNSFTCRKIDYGHGCMKMWELVAFTRDGSKNGLECWVEIYNAKFQAL